jgi:hypothetical protein
MGATRHTNENCPIKSTVQGPRGCQAQSFPVPVQGEAVGLPPYVVARWAAARAHVSVRHSAARPLARVHRRERPNGGYRFCDAAHIARVQYTEVYAAGGGQRRSHRRRRGRNRLGGRGIGHRAGVLTQVRHARYSRQLRRRCWNALHIVTDVSGWVCTSEPLRCSCINSGMSSSPVRVEAGCMDVFSWPGSSGGQCSAGLRLVCSGSTQEQWEWAARVRIDVDVVVDVRGRH